MTAVNQNRAVYYPLLNYSQIIIRNKTLDVSSGYRIKFCEILIILSHRHLKKSYLLLLLLSVVE